MRQGKPRPLWQEGISHHPVGFALELAVLLVDIGSVLVEPSPPVIYRRLAPPLHLLEHIRLRPPVHLHLDFAVLAFALCGTFRGNLV